jgi:hypothetical protein
MHIPKKYIHDRLVLLLVSISAFLTFMAIALVLLRAGIGQGVDGYIVQYRANLGLSAFQKGSIVPILSFVFFVLATLVINVLLSIRAYSIRRTLSLTVLALGMLILLLAIIVSNALLALY